MPPSTLYTWDPRPKETRNFSDESIHNFTVAMSGDPKPSMWESLLPMRYENFTLEQADIEVYRHLTKDFIKNIENCNKEFLMSKSTGQIPGTIDQAESDQWHHQRRFRITASTCKVAVNLGKRFSVHDSLQPHFSFTSKKLWFPSNYTSLDMQYGKDNEIKALRLYGETMNVLVALSGLWINKKYSH